MNEIWKDIEGYEGLYQISNLGNVKSLNYKRSGKEAILKQSNSSGGYKTVTIKNKTRKVHRLVAQAFIPNPNNYPMVNHKDETKDNNNADNLEWCTASYNINYGTARQRAWESFKVIDIKRRNRNKLY